MSPALQIGNPPEQTLIFHITDVGNLEGILEEGGLLSDAVMIERENVEVGYEHIKERRLEQIKIPCCGNRFVGAFVPFYFCPRSPMLYTINRGNAVRPAGSQRSIVHLVSRIEEGFFEDVEWAISDGNASASYAMFEKKLNALHNLDWAAIRATQWSGKTFEKAAEFLVADFFPWEGIHQIGCYDSAVAKQVTALIQQENHRPAVTVERQWYY